jgi:hypothetical protein
MLRADSSRKIFAFYEGENLTCCRVLFAIALALADNGSKKKFTSFVYIYRLAVLPNEDRIRLEWDEKWAKRPVFRDIPAPSAPYSSMR